MSRVGLTRPLTSTLFLEQMNETVLSVWVVPTRHDNYLLLLAFITEDIMSLFLGLTRPIRLRMHEPSRSSLFECKSDGGVLNMHAGLCMEHTKSYMNQSCQGWRQFPQLHPVFLIYQNAQINIKALLTSHVIINLPHRQRGEWMLTAPTRYLGRITSYRQLRRPRCRERLHRDLVTYPNTPSPFHRDAPGPGVDVAP